MKISAFFLSLFFITSSWLSEAKTTGRNVTCHEVYLEYQHCLNSFFWTKTSCVENILIKEYTDHLYAPLNTALRESDQQDRDCQKINTQIINYLNDESYLDHHGLSFSGDVYSGQGLLPELREGIRKEGQCFVMGHYLSTSKSMDEAKKFAEPLKSSFILNFQSHSGVSIENFSKRKSEEEVLFAPGMVLQFLGSIDKYFYIPRAPAQSFHHGEPYRNGQQPRSIEILQFKEVSLAEVKKVCRAEQDKLPILYLFDIPQQ